MRRTLLALAIAGSALGLFACGAEKPEVEIGALLSLTGVGAAYGTPVQQAIELAVEKINADGGLALEGGAKPLRVIFRDDEGSPARALQAASELIEQGVQAVIGGGTSDVALAIAPLFEESRVLLLSPSASTPKLTRAGDYTYRNFPSDELEAINIADYVYNKLSIQEVALVANQIEFGLGIKNAFIGRFRLLGGRLLNQTTYPPDATDFSEAIEALREADPPAVYIAGYSLDTAAVAVAVRAAGLEAVLLGTSAVVPRLLVAAGGEAVEGLVYPLPAYDPESGTPYMRTFVSGFQQKYGQVPGVYAAHGYDLLNILAEAMEQRGVTASEMRLYLNSMNAFEGAAGSTKFNENGDVRKFHRMYRITGGREVPVGSDQG